MHSTLRDLARLAGQVGMELETGDWLRRDIVSAYRITPQELAAIGSVNALDGRALAPLATISRWPCQTERPWLSNCS